MLPDVEMVSWYTSIHSIRVNRKGAWGNYIQAGRGSGAALYKFRERNEAKNM